MACRGCYCGSCHKLLNKSFHYDIRIYSFTARTINTWNSLPTKFVDAESVNTFKTRLDKYWSNQPLLYDFKAELAGTGHRSKCDIELIEVLFSISLVLQGYGYRGTCT